MDEPAESKISLGDQTFLEDMLDNYKAYLSMDNCVNKWASWPVTRILAQILQKSGGSYED